MDLIVSADRIRTMADDDEAATAVAIRGGRIAAVGTREDVSRWRGPATRVVDQVSVEAILGLANQ